ncbi:hypothetical protein [Streptomyces ginkgonis]|uniref:hypothetical protein n=1 Tax=Streptomyces ginkgonis TaxID=1812259 RepID=UPI002176D6AE|nr:hypothetical protein [Streptomyces ginkgonis]
MEDGAYTSHRDWERAEPVWAGLASVQPDRTFWSRSPARETSQERLCVFLPIEAEVDAADRVRIGQLWFQVEGEPQRWPVGSLAHTFVKVWRVKR